MGKFQTGEKNDLFHAIGDRRRQEEISGDL